MIMRKRAFRTRVLFRPRSAMLNARLSLPVLVAVATVAGEVFFFVSSALFYPGRFSQDRYQRFKSAAIGKPGRSFTRVTAANWARADLLRSPLRATICHEDLARAS